MSTRGVAPRSVVCSGAPVAPRPGPAGRISQKEPLVLFFLKPEFHAAACAIAGAQLPRVAPGNKRPGKQAGFFPWGRAPPGKKPAVIQNSFCLGKLILPWVFCLGSSFPILPRTGKHRHEKRFVRGQENHCNGIPGRGDAGPPGHLSGISGRACGAPETAIGPGGSTTRRPCRQGGVVNQRPEGALTGHRTIPYQRRQGQRLPTGRQQMLNSNSRLVLDALTSGLG